MRDENYTPFKPLSPRQHPPRERLWTAGSLSCDLMDHGEFDVEAQILKDGNLTMGRRFESRKMAIQWAELERRSLVTDC